MNTEDTKKEWAAKLKDAAAGITNKQKMMICFNLDINPATFDRYTAGEWSNVRRLEQAEEILKETTRVKALPAEEVPATL